MQMDFQNKSVNDIWTIFSHFGFICLIVQSAGFGRVSEYPYQQEVPGVSGNAVQGIEQCQGAKDGVHPHVGYLPQLGHKHLHHHIVAVSLGGGDESREMI